MLLESDLAITLAKLEKLKICQVPEAYTDWLMKAYTAIPDCPAKLVLAKVIDGFCKQNLTPFSPQLSNAVLPDKARQQILAEIHQSNQQLIGNVIKTTIKAAEKMNQTAMERADQEQLPGVIPEPLVTSDQLSTLGNQKSKKDKSDQDRYF